MNTITKIALNWLEHGIAPIPCHYKSKRPRVMWEQYQTMLPTRQQVLAWFAGEHTNPAIVCGWSGLVVIDFDSMDAYGLWLEWYTRTTEQELAIFDNTLRVITGRGVHLYLMVDEPIESAHLPGIVDIKASGYVLTVPSVHPSGRRYTSNDLPVLRVPTLLNIVPDEWLQHKTQKQYAAPVLASADPLQQVDQVQTSLVETLRSRWAVTDFIKGTPTKDGYQIARCPFHDDHEPSFWIDTKRQLCGCYRGCNSKPMDVINLFGRLNGLSNQDAIHELAQRL
jgi:hypothetical protein